jgi:hypothetical protein
MGHCEGIKGFFISCSGSFAQLKFLSIPCSTGVRFRGAGIWGLSKDPWR